jgi:Ohr subfamily peroxiredoxin
MAKFKLVALTTPVAGKEQEFHAWYQNHHLPEIVAFPGMKGAQRYQLTAKLMGSDSNPWLAIYDLETEEPMGFLGAVGKASAAGKMTQSDANDMSKVYTALFEEYGERVLPEKPSMPVDVKYSTRASAKGGRDGSARTEDGKLDLKLSTPKELGGAGGPGTNPEQLFAAGYSACFIGAMKVAGGQLKIKVPDDASVTAEVGIGPRSEGGFGITASLSITLPGLSREQAQSVVEAAHQICPYSNATRNNVDVRLTVV